MKGRNAVMANIQNMFHQVNVCRKDVDAMRFVWRDNQEQFSSDFSMLVHIFRKIDSPSCANWVLRKSSANCKNYIKQYIENNFYMDNLLKSMSNEDDLIQLSSKLLIILSDCGFRLTKFMLNSINVLNCFPASKISPKIKKLDLTEYPQERVLGMLQNLKADFFTFHKVEKKYQNMKRGILSFAASIFDPLGTLTLFRAKAVNSRTLELRNWLGWKKLVRFAITMGNMATRLLKCNESVYPKMVRISSNKQC